MRNTSAPGISTWPTTRAGSADSVAWISSMVKSFIAITQYHEPGMARMRVATENWYTCTATSSKPSDSLERPRKAALLMNFRMSAVSDLLEPYEGKLSRTDLRGGGDGNIPALPGGGKRAAIGQYLAGRLPCGVRVDSVLQWWLRLLGVFPVCNCEPGRFSASSLVTTVR